MVKVACIIPARYASTRLPGKPLLMIAGKPMIQHVYERASLARLPQTVIVATDHEEVYRAVQNFGGQVMMTSPSHPTGTDRLAEVAERLGDTDILINVQGDEPLIAPDVIDNLAEALAADAGVAMATVRTPMAEAEWNNPNAVKVVADRNGNALYFSRSLIPFPRHKPDGFCVYKHIGIYGYRREFLLTFAALPPTPLEQAESLEQLRALEYGHQIRVITTDHSFVGVDTEEDLNAVRRLLETDGRDHSIRS